MPAKAVESKGRARYPQQHVRPGRGVAGYKGDVEVYATARPASFEEEGGTKSLRTAQDKARKDASDKFADMNVAQLREALEAKGLPVDGNKPDLIARLEAAE